MKSLRNIDQFREGRIIKVLVLLAVCTLPLTLLHADGEEKRQLERFLALEQRVQTACRADVESDLCQVWLHGMLQGVQAYGGQAEKLAGRWALVHERERDQHPRAWLARDVLNAVSCSPDALRFMADFESSAGSVREVAERHVDAACSPLWQAQRVMPTTREQVSMTY
ncbi:MAG: hypothetical protein KDH99_06340 [Alcanivoracaceae bacterium]|nr:hypothetical protein [Alcanivoracaceae bacterium]